MSELSIVSVSTLGPAEDGKIIIKSTEDAIYLITDSVNIDVMDGVNAKFLDKSVGKEINLYGMRDSVINYYITESADSVRNFKTEGELHVLETSVEKTMESLHIDLLRENASADVKNLSILVSDKSKYTQYIDHKMPSTFSNISNVGVAMEGAELVFDTTGKIDKGMAKSKCAQLSRGIVMDDISSVTAKPILLIDEYDCFANHGASIGKMSDEDLFYLMSRGMTKKDAFLLILQGIIRPFVEAYPLEELRNSINLEIQKRIGD